MAGPRDNAGQTRRVPAWTDGTGVSSCSSPWLSGLSGGNAETMQPAWLAHLPWSWLVLAHLPIPALGAVLGLSCERPGRMSPLSPSLGFLPLSVPPCFSSHMVMGLWWVEGRSWAWLYLGCPASQHLSLVLCQAADGLLWASHNGIHPFSSSFSVGILNDKLVMRILR